MTRRMALLVVTATIALLLLDLLMVLRATPAQPIRMYDCPVGSGANAPSECAP